LVGGAIASSGFGDVIYGGVIKIAIFIVVAPVLGMLMSFIISSIVLNLFRKGTPRKVDKIFRSLQILSASAFSLGHGGNEPKNLWESFGWL
jgi:inorganic phosphate transporter, PiT family